MLRNAEGLRINTIAGAILLLTVNIGYADNTEQPKALKLKEVNVQSQASTEQQAKKELVYIESYSSTVIDQADFERFKGSNTGDILRGQVGVFNADTRKSGLSPNIRGIMGDGKIPVTVDGIENNTIQNKGFYTGNQNTSYIDTNLLVEATIVKGPAISRDVSTSTAGGIAFRTIGPRDILKPEEKFGALIKFDINNNTTNPRFPTLPPAGIIYPSGSNPISEKAKLKKNYPVHVESRQHNPLSNIHAGSGMAALAWRNDNISLMAAYSQRKQGNYFSGTKGGQRYIQSGSNHWDYNKPSDWRIPVARLHLPGREVTNTSNDNRTWIFKGEWNISSEQQLVVTSRFTKQRDAGMQSSSYGAYANMYRSISKGKSIFDSGFTPQFFEGKVKEKAYSIDYRYKPENQPWLDIKAQAWLNRLHQVGNNATRGDVLDVKLVDHKDESKGYQHVNSTSQTMFDNRHGLSISNLAQLTPELSLLTGFNYQNQHQWVRQQPWQTTPARDGKRWQNKFYFNLSYQPLDWLEIDAGATRVAYGSKDPGYQKLIATSDLLRGKRNHKVLLGYQIGIPQIGRRKKATEYQKKYPDIIKGPARDLYAEWYFRDDGRLYREDNPFYNGTVEIDPNDFKDYDANLPVQKSPGVIPITDPPTNYVLPDASSNKGHAWAPSLTLTLKKFNSRLYARLSQDVRMPTLFETNYFGDTYVMNRDYQIAHGPKGKLRPEKSRNFELGFSHDFSRYFSTATAADIKLSYYDIYNTDVIDMRYLGTEYFIADNFEKQKIKGLELQARFDNSRIFAELSGNYNLKNKLCDNQMMLYSSSYWNNLNVDCVDYGFLFGTSRHSRTPKYSANLLIGARFMDGRLELGSRITHHSTARPDSDQTGLILKQDMVGMPIEWSSATIYDAFINYKFNKTGTLELSATNLGNRYYVDPLARSWMPAPGRTVRLGIKMQF